MRLQNELWIIRNSYTNVFTPYRVVYTSVNRLLNRCISVNDILNITQMFTVEP